MKKIIFTSEQINTIKEFYSKNVSFTDIGKKFNCDRKTIVRILKEEGVYKKTHKQQRLNFSSKDKQNIVNLYTEANKSVKEIAEVYGYWSTTILYILNSENVETKRKRLNHNFKKYEVDEGFFDKIDNERKAYWFGFILADGHITKKIDHLIIGLQKQDLNHLYKFRESVKSNHPIKMKKDQNSYEINIGSSILCKTLYDKGIHNRKSWKIDIQQITKNVPNNLINHFIRGIFDGDGCIKKYKQTYYNRPLYHFSIVGLFDLLNFVKMQMDVDLSLNYDMRTKSTYELKTKSKTKILAIKEYLYKDANIYLERKYNEFFNIF